MGPGSRATSAWPSRRRSSSARAARARAAHRRQGAGGAAAQSAPADVETAEQLYAKLDYEQANAVAERVVKKSGLTHDQLVRAYRVLAVTYAVLDKEEQARDAFLQLLTYDADYQADPNLGSQGEHAVHGGARQLPVAADEAGHRGLGERLHRAAARSASRRATRPASSRRSTSATAGRRRASTRVSQINSGEAVAGRGRGASRGAHAARLLRAGARRA